ncbi:hypothetical protein [Sphingomonas kyeonggiensis]|uniref:Uncharacterized protein n=1 Tax=Sphingomonas kyeonggiensis TaxID=1268553 RepID=A0A7W6JQJ1_9SPHN|nr:hypothetical protein [Sphingomonas kyeonggiensis]MBB4096661.1 hypothetical protein [Sphingomonas kyeonggiensis]
MRMFKLVLSLLPLVYVGGLLFYFTGFNGWNDGVLASGLGPTVLGLAAVGLLLCIPLIFRLLKLAITPRGPSESKGGDLEEAAESSFDADAALARYLARKAAAGEPMPDPSQASFPQGDGQPRPVFGRKIG